MTKRELIDEIVVANPTAQPEFLAGFDDTELNEYLLHLRVLKTPRLTGNASRFDKYFRNVPAVGSAVKPSPAPLQRTAVATQDDVPTQREYSSPLCPQPQEVAQASCGSSAA